MFRTGLLLDLGRTDEALEQAEALMVRADEVSDVRYRARARLLLGRAQVLLGDAERARAQLEKASEVLRGSGEYLPEIEVLLALAEAELALGRAESAEARARDVLALSRAQLRAKDAEALVFLAWADLAQGRPDDAVGHAEQALAFHRANGQLLGQARALHALGEAVLGSQSGRAAEAHLREAHRIFTAAGSPEAHRIRADFGTGTA